MKELKDKELYQIIGGGLSGAVITAVIKGINSLLDLGRSLGTAIRRLQTGRYC